MHTVEFVSTSYLERAAWSPGLIVYSRPVQVERRVNVRRADDRVHRLLQSLRTA